MSGDFSPLTVDTSGGETRLAPPAMLVAMAVGLGTMDMPIPRVATWEWVNWKFPKPVHAGETVYARWTLTQKRPPVHGARTGIAVWRVDVHTADGAMAAEGEIGAAIFRGAAPAATSERAAEPAPASGSRRRRRRRGGSSAETPAAPPPPQAEPAPAPAAERPSRRRRRRRPSGGGQNGDAQPATTEPAREPEPVPVVQAPPPPQPAPTPRPAADANPISRVMKRLRRT